MTDEAKLKLYRMFHEYGVICLCTTCGEKNYCACSVVDLSAECFHCAVKRIEREEQQREKLKNFDLEDFCRL